MTKGSFWTGFLLLFLFLPTGSLQSATLSGTIRDLDGNAMSSIQVNLSGDETQIAVTNGSGFYSFSGITSGANVTVTPDQAGVIFTPTSRSYTNLTTDQPNQDFTNGKNWTGGGSNNLASNPDNWSGNQVPAHNDKIRFGSSNPTKNCTWDLTVSVEELRLMSVYVGTVTAAANMTIQDLTIESGVFDMSTFEHIIQGQFNHTGGRFEAGVGGTARFSSSVAQQISMGVSNLGNNIYESYFYNITIANNNTVTITSELVVDGTFSLSFGSFDADNQDITLTGGANASAGPGAKLNWSDTGGSFQHTNGTLTVNNSAREVRINQRSGNSFHHVQVVGSESVEAVSNLVINGDLLIQPSGSNSHFNLGEFFSHNFYGRTTIGPSSTPTDPTLILDENSTVNFYDEVTVGTATFKIMGGNARFLGSSLTVRQNGILQVSGLLTGTLTFDNNSIFTLTDGTLDVDGPARMTSTSLGSNRYTTDLNGTLDIQGELTLDSMDANGFHLGANATPVHLDNITVTETPTGGVGIYFDPITVTPFTMDSPSFGVSVSTNIKANLGSLPDADINVINPDGFKSGELYESDPFGIINWGIIGTPQSFTGNSSTSTTITWSWVIENNPLGFLVQDQSGTNISASLGGTISNWVETGLTVNTVYTRRVQAFTDNLTSNSNVATVYTLANQATNLSASQVYVSSLTLSWQENNNPSHTTYSLERSNDGVSFSEIVNGAYSDIHPFIDTGLSPETEYHYQVKAVNGDGIQTPAQATILAEPLPTPPPVVIGISPGSMNDLGTTEFQITGAHFQTEAVVRFRFDQNLVYSASSQTTVSDTLITGSINLTGAFAGLWDVEVENPDGKISLGSGQNLLTVTKTTTSLEFFIQDYNPDEVLKIRPPRGETRLDVQPGSLGVGRVFLSEDPLNNPLSINPSRIDIANAKLFGVKAIPGTLPEILAYDQTGLITHTFSSPAELTLPYPDANNDRVVDGVFVRDEAIRMMTLNEETLVWENIEDITLNHQAKEVTGRLKHFSVYGLFGAAPASSLSDVRLYPNPWKPGSHGGFDSTQLTIAGLTASGTIKIYSVDGILVRTLHFDPTWAGQMTWDGLTSNGDKAASGVYLIYVEGAGGDTILKLGIER